MPTREEILAKILNNKLLREKRRIFTSDEHQWLTFMTARDKDTINQQYDGEYYAMIAEGLYRFKQIYSHYLTLYREQNSFSTLYDTRRWEELLSLVIKNFNSFCKTRYLKRLTYWGNLATKQQLPPIQNRKYLTWVLDFPVVPACSVEEVLEYKKFPFNFPHVYLQSVQPILYACFKNQKTTQEIEDAYRQFTEREMDRKLDHDSWYYNKRLPGSYGSGRG